MLLAAVMGGGYLGYQSGLLHLVNPSSSRFPVRGIDVSHHQGAIDWVRVADDLHGGFAFIKASEGATFQDPNFKKNWQAAGAAKLPHGAYHFFTLCRSGAEQAQNFLKQLDGQRGDLPPAVDLEFGGNCAARPAPDDLAREIAAFGAELSKTDDRLPLFYLTPEFYSAYFVTPGATFPNHRLWIRSVFGEPAQSPCTEWTIWQFAENGRVSGIAGPVDLNVFCSAKEFSTLMQ